MANKPRSFQKIRKSGIVTGVLIGVLMGCLAPAAHSQAVGTIVFQSDRDTYPNTQIYSMNADGTAVARLTNDTYIDRNPAVSHDGKKVAFVYRAKREVQGSKIRVIWGKVTRTHGMWYSNRIRGYNYCSKYLR